MKKILTLILVLAAVLSVSGVALAADGNLDIADGSIVIDADGYTQGANAKEYYSGDYAITQTGDKTTDKTITINSVATGATVTLQNLNMVYEVNNETGPVIVNASTTLILNGTNTLKGGHNGTTSTCLGALTINGSANVTIQGSGTLNATGVQRAAGIYVGGSAALTIADGTINATGGAQFAAAGIGASDYQPAGTIIINGGTITAKYGTDTAQHNLASAIGGSLNNGGSSARRSAKKIVINGGVVNAISDSAKAIASIHADSVEINGGTINCSKYPAISGKQLVKLAFYDENGAVIADEKVTVDSWEAVTDANGVVYMYLDSAAVSVTATVDGEVRTANINGDEALFAPNCTCTAGSGTIEWVGSFEDVTLYNGVDSREIAISAKYVAGDGCKAPVHGDFETVTITENSDHAVYADGKLTVNRHTDNYEVTLNAAANGTSAESKTIKVTSETMKGFDLMAGTITFDGTKYTQNGVDYYPATKDEQVVVYGSGTTDNYLEVTAGTANVILDNVDITAAARGDYMDANGIIRVFGGELNLMLKGENRLERGRGGLINVGKDGSTNVDDAVITIDCVEEAASLTLISTPKDGSGQASSALIGGYSGNTMAGTINIQGGNIIIPNACGVGIGSPRGSTSGSAEYHYDINISGGSVDIDEVNQLCTGIGLGCGAGEDAVVNVNITGGNVDVASTYNSTDAGVAIGASGYTEGNMNIAIGDKNNPGKTDPVVKATTGDYMIAIGAAGGSSVSLKIDIFGGKVTANSNSVAIGGSISGGESRGIKSCDITISGGDVSANGGHLAIGVGGPAGYPDTETAVKRKIDASIEISGDAKVTATARKMAIGMTDMGASSEMDIAIKDTATVEATATGTGVEYGAAIAIGTEKGEYADKYGAAPAAGSTTIAITSPNVTMNADKPLAAATETTLAGGTAYTVKTDKGTMTVTVPDGADSTINDEDVILPAGTKIEDDKGNTIVLTKDGKLDEVDTTPTTSGGSSYSGPSIWYIGGNSFGTSTTRMPTSVEIDYVSVPFTMESSNIVVSCINPGARWATVKWNSTSATIRFNPDANVVCAQVVIPKTGDMPIWAAIAQFLGF